MTTKEDIPTLDVHQTVSPTPTPTVSPSPVTQVVTEPPVAPTLESTIVDSEDVRLALIAASDDAIVCFKYTHKPTGTPLFLSNGFLTEKSRFTVMWAFQFMDTKTDSIKTYRKIHQNVIPTFSGEGKNMIVQFRSIKTYPSVNVTNELVADFLMCLQTCYPDISVTKVKPTQLETAVAKAQMEKKELESKSEVDKYAQAFENFKQLQEEKKQSSVESTFYDGAGINPQAWVNDDEASPTLNTSEEDISKKAIVKTLNVDGAKLFQDSKLKEQIAIVHDEICKHFQPLGGFIKEDSRIVLKETCFVTTDLQQAVTTSPDEILAKGSIMMQITPLHLQPNDQLWMRFIGNSQDNQDNQLIEIDGDSFGLFVECKFSQPLQSLAIIRFLPVFKSTNKRKQDVVNTAVKNFLNSIDLSLQAFFKQTKLTPSQKLGFPPADIVTIPKSVCIPSIQAQQTQTVSTCSTPITLPISLSSSNPSIPSTSSQTITEEPDKKTIKEKKSGPEFSQPTTITNPNQRADINLEMIQEVPQSADDVEQSLYSTLPENPVMRIHSSLLKKQTTDAIAVSQTIPPPTSITIPTTIPSTKNNNNNRRRGARHSKPAARSQPLSQNNGANGKKETLF